MEKTTSGDVNIDSLMREDFGVALAKVGLIRIIKSRRALKKQIKSRSRALSRKLFSLKSANEAIRAA